MRLSGTRLWLAIALLVTLAAAWFAPAPADNTVVLRERKQGAASEPGGEVARASQPEIGNRIGRTNPPETSRTEVLSIRVRGIDDDSDRLGSLFKSAPWRTSTKPDAAPVKAPLVLSPEAAVAPPLPFKAFGRYEQGGQASIFLRHAEQNIVARVGDIIAENYKVEEINGTNVILRYVPLNQVQTLELGAAP